jgi:hypothetical protein
MQLNVVAVVSLPAVLVEVSSFPLCRLQLNYTFVKLTQSQRRERPVER